MPEAQMSPAGEHGEKIAFSSDARFAIQLSPAEVRPSPWSAHSHEALALLRSVIEAPHQAFREPEQAATLQEQALMAYNSLASVRHPSLIARRIEHHDETLGRCEGGLVSDLDDLYREDAEA